MSLAGRGLLSLLLLAILSTASWATPWVVAHRGGALGPENSLATFQKAIELGVDAIELDIHQSRDGHLVVIHDVTLARTYPGHDGRVDEMTLAELVQIGVPTLDRALTVTQGRCRLLIEIKQPTDRRHPGIEDRLVTLLRAHKMSAEVVVISFDAESLRRVHQLEPTLQTGYLTGPLTSLAKAQEIAASYVAPHYRGVTSDFVKSAHEKGLKVNVWTVDDPLAQKAMIEAGCDAITTNEPAQLLKLIPNPATRPPRSGVR